MGASFLDGAYSGTRARALGLGTRLWSTGASLTH